VEVVNEIEGKQTTRCGGHTRRQFIQEFKMEAVRLATLGDRPVSQVARELGIRPDMLYQWKRQAEGRLGQELADVFPGTGR
jgi:transposase